MRWASVSATDSDISEVIERAAEQLRSQLGGVPDLVLLFVGSDHYLRFAGIPELLQQQFESALVIGMLCQHSIAEGREHGDESTVSLMGAVLPDVTLQARHLDEKQIPPVYAERSMWDSALNLSAPPDCMLLLGAPFTFDHETFVKGLDRQYPDTPKVGGLSSGVDQPDVACLLINDRTYRSGALVLSMSGNIAVDTLVAQGCRPVGDPMFANNTHENLLIELDGKVPRDVLTELFGKLNRSDRQLFTQALFLGIAMDKKQEAYAAGDYLIRAIMGLDPQSGSLWVSSPVPANSVVQLHVRDATTAAQELDQLLHRYRSSPNSRDTRGALLMSCTGRSNNLHQQINYDCNAFVQSFNDIPLGGCFCNGEIGPVRGTTYLHSFTSVFALFREKHARATH
jgi:small ligand-binding sensory domain FIST